jgi:hypothetical protein
MPSTSPVNATRGRIPAVPFEVAFPGNATTPGTALPASFAAHICLTFIRAIVASASFGQQVQR